MKTTTKPKKKSNITFNSFFRRIHENKKINNEPSKTSQAIIPSIQELIRTGKIEEYGEYQKSKMIFGTKPRLEDLTSIDRFRKIQERINNLLITREEIIEQKKEMQHNETLENNSIDNVVEMQPTTG